MGISWSGIKRLVGEGTWVVAGQAAALVGALVGVRLLTNVLAPAAYGELALGMTLATFANQLVLGPIGNAILRFYAPAVEQQELGGYLHAVRGLVGWGTLVIAILATTLMIGLAVAGHLHLAAVVAIAFVFSVISGYGGLISATQSAARHRGIVAFHQGLDPWARAVAAVTLIGWVRASGSVALAGYCVGSLLMLCSQSIFFRRILRDRTERRDPGRRWRSKLSQYSLPFVTWGAFTWCQLVSDRWALEWFATRDDVGVYSALYQIGYAPIYLGTAMAVQFIEPILFMRAGDATDASRNTDVARLVKRLTIMALALTGIAFAGAAILHGRIFTLLVAPEYRVASPLLPWIALSGGIFAAGQTLTLNLLSTLQPRAMVSVKIGTALLGIGCNFLGASVAGPAGVVFANLAFSASFFGWMVYLFKRTTARHQVGSNGNE